MLLYIMLFASTFAYCSNFQLYVPVPSLGAFWLLVNSNTFYGKGKKGPSKVRLSSLVKEWTRCNQQDQHYAFQKDFGRATCNVGINHAQIKWSIGDIAVS